VNAPCKDCKDRKMFCHGSCGRYKEFRKELDRIAEEKKRKDAATPQLGKEIIRKIWREMKGRRK